MTPAVSVIIPHLRQEAALRTCLRALSDQEEAPPFEVIVVDNGSPAPPAAAVAMHRFARLADEPEPGPGPARNRGAGLARAPILAFLDADCLPEAHWLSAIAERFAVEPEAAILGGPVRVAPRNPARPSAVEAYECVFGYRIRLYIDRDGYAGSGNLALRRNVFDAVGPFAGIRLAEDMDWGRRARAMGFQTLWEPGMLVRTAARGDFPALARKWDRQIAHQFAAWQQRGGSDGTWLLRAGAIALSSLAEVPRLAFTRELSGPRTRLAAMSCTMRIRIWRACRMAELALGADPAPLLEAWRA